jgi:hypothetical protein
MEPPSDDEVVLGELEPGEPSGNTNVAGINLHSPADSGVNLEKPDEISSDSLEFELSLEPEATPKPTVEAPDVDSSGEFELTLDEGAAAAGKPESGSDSGEKDIFETDFDMPALDEESGSEVQALEPDTELESSDFDLSLGDEGSGSQVVALEGEEADEGAATVAYKGGKKAPAPPAEDEAPSQIEELLSDEELGELSGEESGLRQRAPIIVAAPPASWGPLPAIILIPCVIVMFLLACMSFELLNNMWGFKQPTKASGVLVKAVAGLLGEKLPE